MRFVLLFVVAMVAATGAEAKQVLSNPSFTAWSHGSPVRGSYGPGSVTADHWVSKWSTSHASSATMTRTSYGARYSMHPGPGGETFYLRQTVGPLSAHLGHTYRAVVDAYGTPATRYGFYINARWNHTNRVYLQNTVSYGPMPKQRIKYETVFKMPTNPHPEWHRDGSQGIEFAFLMTSKVPTVVHFFSARMYQVK